MAEKPFCEIIHVSREEILNFSRLYWSEHFRPYVCMMSALFDPRLETHIFLGDDPSKIEYPPEIMPDKHREIILGGGIAELEFSGDDPVWCVDVRRKAWKDMGFQVEIDPDITIYRRY